MIAFSATFFTFNGNIVLCLFGGIDIRPFSLFYLGLYVIMRQIIVQFRVVLNIDLLNTIKGK